MNVNKSNLGQVNEPLLKKESPYGVNVEKAQKNLESYEKKMPRILEGLKTSKAKASDKKKVEAKVKRMHKYFKDGVDYAKAVEETKNNPNPESPFFSDGNSKLLKDGIISFNLPAGHSCPGKGDCFGICYAMQGPQSWPDAMKKRVHNWGMAERSDFVQRVNDELKKWPKRSKHSASGQIGNTVRVHDSGDFYSQDYIDKWHQIAKSNPDKHFYAYTKALDLDWKKLHELPNFTVIQSVGSKHDHLIDPKLPHSYIFGSEDAMKSAGYTDTHDSDMPAANAKKNPKIGLVVHGIFSKAYDKDTYGGQFKNKIKKSLQKSVGMTDNIPAAYKFDQIDHVSQLKHSSHPLDKLQLMSMNYHGETKSLGFNGIDDGLETSVNNILRGEYMSKPVEMIKDGKLEKQTNMASAASSIRGAFGTPAPAAPAPAPTPAPASGSLASNITAGLNTFMGKSNLKKDDKPHAPMSPEDSAHDVVEERSSLKGELSQQSTSEDKSKMLSHLRQARHEEWKRNKMNQMAGADKSFESVAKSEDENLDGGKVFKATSNDARDQIDQNIHNLKNRFPIGIKSIDDESDSKLKRLQTLREQKYGKHKSTRELLSERNIARKARLAKADAKEEHYKLSEELGRNPTDKEMQERMGDIADRAMHVNPEIVSKKPTHIHPKYGKVKAFSNKGLASGNLAAEIMEGPDKGKWTTVNPKDLKSLEKSKWPVAGEVPPSGSKLNKKQGVPEGVDPNKQERCVKDVKKKNVDNPYAVCNAALSKEEKLEKDVVDIKTGKQVRATKAKVEAQAPKPSKSTSLPNQVKAKSKISKVNTLIDSLKSIKWD